MPSKRQLRPRKPGGGKGSFPLAETGQLRLGSIGWQNPRSRTLRAGLCLNRACQKAGDSPSAREGPARAVCNGGACHGNMAGSQIVSSSQKASRSILVGNERARLAGSILPGLPALQKIYRPRVEGEPNKLPSLTGKYFPGNRQSLPDLAPIQFVTIISFTRQETLAPERLRPERRTELGLK